MSIPRTRWLLGIGAIVVVAILFRFATPATVRGDDALVTKVKRGPFKVAVNTTGELRARKFVQISGPANLQQAEIWNGIKITSLVPEGTLVKTGAVVAELDRSAIASKLSEVSLALQKAQAQYTGAQLDSALNLSQAREDERNAEFALEEKRIAKEQSQFEAPSIQRQAAIDYEKAQRALAQSKTNYVTKTDQAKAKMSEVDAEVQRQRNKLTIIQQVMEGFTVKAPSDGMVIYQKEWNGRKRDVGSQVSPWDPTVATLPDLLQMESVTYVNEIDVRKLAVGQKAAIGLDADPKKKLTGVVTAVANVGEQRPNADAKVFEVKVSIDQADTTLRPGMTTSNAIETKTIPSALMLPIEAVMNDGGVPFVYKKNGARMTRQEIEAGTTNENEIVIARGLAEGDEVLLSPPSDRKELPLDRLPPGKDAPVGDTARNAVQIKTGAAPGKDSAKSPTSH